MNQIRPTLPKRYQTANRPRLNYKLKTEQNTPEMYQTVLYAAAYLLDAPATMLQAYFEHGQWWITRLDNGAQYSVCDAEAATERDEERAGIIEGFCLEQVTEGDEE